MAAPVTTNSNPAVSLALLGGIVAGFRKAQPIGGWLYFFLWEIFAAVLLTLLNVFQDRARFVPSGWVRQTNYLMYMLSYWPRVGALLFVTAAAIVLIRRRNLHSVDLLRTGLIAYLATHAATVAIDMIAFPASRTAAILALVFPMVFLIYTFQSRRFARVFGM